MSEEKEVKTTEEAVPAESKEEKPAAEKKAAKPVILLTEEQTIPGAYEAYLLHIKSIVPLRLELDPSKSYEVDEVWALMNDSDKNGVNKAYKKKGKFGAGGGAGKQAIARSQAHQEAMDIQKGIRDGAQAFISDNHMDDFNKLQGLSPETAISIEIYFKGWTKFVAGLPDDE